MRQRRTALHQVVVCGPRGIGPVLTEAEQARIDDARVDGGHRFVVESEPRHGIGPHVVDQHVRVGQQAVEHVQPGRFLQVERDAALAAIGIEEDRTHVGVPTRADLAHQVALRGLDLDDVRAHVAQRQRRERPHQHRRHVDDLDAVQWTHVMTSIFLVHDEGNVV